MARTNWLKDSKTGSIVNAPELKKMLGLGCELSVLQLPLIDVMPDQVIGHLREDNNISSE
jgi:hypothetical protein